jgi:hypothetical protein
VSPTVRLHTYPAEDGDFSSGVTLELEVPEDALLVEEVLARLRGRYPGVAIRVEDGDGTDRHWHVYRDGLPI